MRYIIAILTIFLSISLFSSRATKFTGNPDTYINELKKYMSNVSDAHEGVVEDFIAAWESDSLFSLPEQKDIVELSQKLELKNARPYPHFVNFLSFYLVIKKYGIAPENYLEWKKGMEYHLSVKKANSGLLNKLLIFSASLVSDNIIYSSASIKWKATSDKYRIIGNEGLFVEYDNTELVCYLRNDSLNLYNTKGRLDPENIKWNGQGGQVSWERGGYSREDVFATLKDYTISLNKSEYIAKNVTFTNKIYFNEPMEGDLKDKVKHITKPENATFPQFYSYTETFELENLYPDVNYKGGLSMQGAKLVGTGTRENPAKLFIYRNDTIVLEAGSLYFGFKADRVSSRSTSVSIKLKQDSIFHPDLFFTFRVKNRELTLLKTDKYSSLGPYSNSYHNIDMNFDQLTWNLNEDFMRFSASKGAAIGKANFESVNFFNLQTFENMQMMDQAHPLVMVRSFARGYGEAGFPISALANYLHQPVQSVKHLIMRLAYSGFVLYDNNTEIVKVKPRLHDYLAASINKIDYDVMSFSSTVETPMENAVFNLRTNDLIINGIPKIFVSDSQNVVIYPRNSRIIFKKNRNFQFDGTVTAGLLTFHGENLFFSYDSFRINLQNVDSVNIDYLTGELDNYGLPRVGHIESTLQNVTGEILIDKADNKSGRVSYPEYPIFRSNETSYVYYNVVNDNKSYDTSNFYYAVEPFEMDSLDNYNALAMNYKGKLVSGGILPDIEKELSIQPDNSLGFVYESPEEGMELYGGKGYYNNKISLSNQGLKGGGSIRYLTSTIWSENFNFYPDSMNTKAEKFEIRKQTTGTQYPVTKSLNNNIHWEPYNEKLWAERTDTDFTLFNDSTALAGTLLLEPTGLTGSGRMDLKNSDLLSEGFAYKSDEILADSSDFFLKSLQAEGFTVLTENVNSHIDYRKRKGWFTSNEEYSLVTFPENKYISYIDVFEWDMNKKTLAMGTDSEVQVSDTAAEDVEPIGPRYISTDPNQDSLNFVAPKAYYDYQNNFINATGVKFIEIADARIYPKDGLVTVQPNFLIRRLTDSRIRANTTLKYHTLHNASVEIASRHDYHGMANYDYIDENGDVQIIHFSEIFVDDSLNTRGRGDIYLTADFTLSPVFDYQGEVFLYAPDSLLTFKGSTQIESNCNALTSDWLFFETKIDPNNIYIPVQNESKNIDRRKIFNTMFVHYDSTHIYPAFLSQRKNYSDRQMVKPEGFIHYEKGSMLYKVGSKEKIKDFTLSEEYLSFHREDCKLYGEGAIDLGQNLGQVKIKNYGSFRHDVELNKTEFDLVMGIDFFIAEDMINLAGQEIDSFPNLTAVNLNRSMITKTMNAWVGKEQASKLKDELNLMGTINQLPKELKYTILLNELKLVWNNETNSYQSKGKIGVASINGIQINKKVDGFFELRLKRSGDIMDLYLQMDRRTYYYFGYTRGVMQTLSSNKVYVETIMNMKINERKQKTDRGATPYNYLISTDKKKNNFYRRWQNVLSGKSVMEGIE
jgi:hypothetical protein